jgi:hypothetical protein
MHETGVAGLQVGQQLAIQGGEKSRIAHLPHPIDPLEILTVVRGLVGVQQLIADVAQIGEIQRGGEYCRVGACNAFEVSLVGGITDYPTQ